MRFLKILVLAFIGMVFFYPSVKSYGADNPLAVDGQQSAVPEPSQSGIKRIFKVFGRGLINAVTIPLEITRTFSDEKEKHPRAWPLSYLPKLTGNLMIRGISAVHDAALYPFYINFKDDSQPFTRSGNLPDYPWQKKPAADHEVKRLIVTSSRG